MISLRERLSWISRPIAYRRGARRPVTSCHRTSGKTVSAALLSWCRQEICLIFISWGTTLTTVFGRVTYNVFLSSRKPLTPLAGVNTSPNSTQHSFSMSIELRTASWSTRMYSPRTDFTIRCAEEDQNRLGIRALF